MKIFGREPALWIGALNVAIGLVGTLGLRFVSQEQAALWIALVNALSAAANAWTVRPIAPSTFAYLINAGVALVAGYGYQIPGDTIAALQLGIVPILALLTRNQVSPVDTVVTRTTTPAEKAIAEPGTGAAPLATTTR